ncbi:MAG: uroporphyrin-III C-methyltransferase/precorrin-2 dehydrogenase/sirohydrochlorin ferrochelatase [Psychrosphaera sp.]|jgi:uroporphyrin-III C-methyltransferase/precorrin-2 dehydrogenase/sirohydrochlorin ferrochelatase
MNNVPVSISLNSNAGNKVNLPSVNTRVYLVGGGPGDPDLLTIKALRVIQAADVIVYDYLITDEILTLCRTDAEYISVGKKAGNHTLPQDQINQLLVDLANQGKVVCRLKGGDPYIYGRGGEEAQLLSKHNIPYQVVPGITAAAACSAAVGIPLTHRDYAQSLQFVTGHLKKSTDVNAESDTNWQSLASTNQTLVIYMGIIQSPEIKHQLIKHGRAATTPVAIIEKGTRPDQRVVIGTLATLDELVQSHKIGSPALIIVGEVVNLYSELNGQDVNNQANQEAQQELTKIIQIAQEQAA